MTLRFRPNPARAGFTLFEALISLALIALVLAVGIAAARPPSPALQAQAQISRLGEAAAQARFEAISMNRNVVWEPNIPSCEDEPPPQITFFADGTALGSDLCILQLRIRAHRLTGLLKDVTNE